MSIEERIKQMASGARGKHHSVADWPRMIFEWRLEDLHRASAAVMRELEPLGGVQ